MVTRERGGKGHRTLKGRAPRTRAAVPAHLRLPDEYEARPLCRRKQRTRPAREVGYAAPSRESDARIASGANNHRDIPEWPGDYAWRRAPRVGGEIAYTYRRRDDVAVIDPNAPSAGPVKRQPSQRSAQDQRQQRWSEWWRD